MKERKKKGGQSKQLTLIQIKTNNNKQMLHLKVNEKLTCIVRFSFNCYASKQHADEQNRVNLIMITYKCCNLGKCKASLAK